MISPGANDGIADSFGRGDIWFLRTRPNQFDDGVEAIGPPYEAQIDNFVNHELIKNKDVVVWYGAHFTHTTKHDDDAATGHIVGPDLRPLDLQE
jgi:Cu2+-containing amine oxidase